MVSVGLVVIAAALLGWAVWSNYGKTDPTQSPAKRAGLAIVAAFMALAAWVATLFQSPPQIP